ncbi:hydroxyethylthiazole kinase [Microbacterium esteraromaticum]|uniref:hydroxyethylthiazole kinase n=1 Tax=Microbacterium esteraromaticum TaxID=57043 RepID=UPI0019D3F2C7|nr:hydroxyethylthiazole kinase [Microbacterium esteraromaticum]MBN7794936.1 hydroxyethylthiazole kinase [Microbacterium esteraromaticum]
MSDRLRPSARIPAAAAELLREVRRTPPLTQCITNTVVTGFTANVLLATGAAPAMVGIVGESGIFAGIADALLVNLGTPPPEQRAAMSEAVRGANTAGTPWVLDPVAIGALPVRTALAAELVAQHPTAVRGNASEILALAGTGAGGRGVDAVDAPEAATEAARTIAARWGSVVAVSGATDLITDGERVIRIANGDPLLTRVTGGGCALGAVIAAFLGAARATGADAMTAVAAATLVYTVAAERAAKVAAGPGSFAVAFIDALAAVEADDLLRDARIEEDAR